jgi:glucose-6-phosphate 1-dehydrogenase
MQTPDRGFTRIVIEKPFGRDLRSYKILSASLSQYFNEQQLYRIDHYLGKSVVPTIGILQYSNVWLTSIWNYKHISAVYIVWKERHSLEKRGGGYFDNFGIVRDVLQNHLLQLLTLVAMEQPVSDKVDGIRNAKMKVLENMEILHSENVFLGQYEGYGKHVNSVASTTPTYGMVVCRVNTPRWQGVPFVMEAGKALDENGCEVRMKFHNSVENMPANALVLRLQPDPAIYIRCVVMI